MLFFFLFFEYIRHLEHLHFEKIIYVLGLSAVWFVASDVFKKRRRFSQSVHFIIDSVFYLLTFGFVVYYTGGMHGDFSPIFFLAAISAAIFGTTFQTLVFLIILTIESYFVCILATDNLTAYHLGVTTLYAVFYFIIAGLIRYFYINVKKSREEYVDLIESTPLCVKVFDSQGNLTFLNKGGREEHFIKDNVDISKWDWLETVKEEYRQTAKKAFEKALQGESVFVQFEHTPEGSSHKWCSGIISPIKDKDGKVKSILFYSADITALKETEMEIKKNEQILRVTLDSTPLFIKFFDKNGNLVFMNKGAREEHFLEDKSEEEIKKWSYFNSVKKEYRPAVERAMSMALKGEIGHLEVEHVPGASRNKWCFSSFLPIKNDKGETEYMLLVSRNIDEEKKIEEERKKNLEKAEETKIALFNILEDVKESELNLKEERDRSQAIISSMGEGLFVVDKDFKIVLINSAAEKIFEMPREESIGQDLRKIWSVYKAEEKIPDEKRPIIQTLKTGKTIFVGVEDNFYYHKIILPGKKFPVSLITAPLKGDGITGVVVVFKDITKEKELDEAKSSFISIASHQLRTPLTSIRWYAEMLDSEDVGPLNKEQKDFIGRVYDGALRLNEVINLLLVLARIESGKAEMEPKKTDIVSFTKDILKELEPLIKQKNTQIRLILPEPQLLEINYDGSMLRQIVTNLLSNSIRYTDDKGRIEIEIKKTPGSVVYSVKDDGIGIPLGKREKIFTKFFRAENAVAKVPDGSGLGLSLVKALVEMNKGSVWFESPAIWIDEAGKTEKKGTAFHFTIPISVISN